MGEPLPRAADAWCVEEKWAAWILADHGHGRSAPVTSASHYAMQGAAPRLVTAYPTP